MGETSPAAPAVSFGPFRLDMTNRMLSRDGIDVALPPRAVAVLWLLVARAGHVVSKQDLLDTVWKDAYVSDTSLAEAISLVRHTLGDDPQQPAFIQTLPRRGYRFVAPISVEHGTDRPASLAIDLAAAPVTGADTPLWTPWAPYIACFAAGIAVGLAAMAMPTPPQEPPRAVVRLALGLPDGVVVDSSARPIAVSRRGDVCALIVRDKEGSRHLALRRLERSDLSVVRDSEGAAAPFFSPDGRWIAFFARGRLYKALVASGVPEPIADASAALGGAWADDETIVFASRWTGGLDVVAAAGGSVHPLTTPDAESGEVRHAWPMVVEGSPGDLSFTIAYGLEAASGGRGAFVNTRTRTITRLDVAATDVRPLVTGHLLLIDPGHAAVVAMDFPSRSITGLPVTLADPVETDPVAGGAAVALSTAGLRVALESGPVAAAEWLDRDGARQLLTTGLVDLEDLALAPDGTRIAGVERHRDIAQLWVVDVIRGARTRVASARRLAAPAWSPDGREVAYATSNATALALSIARADGSTQPRVLLAERGAVVPTGWSADARSVLVARSGGAGGWDLARVPVEGGAAVSLAESQADEVGGVVSPDGRWLAYETNQAGGWGIAVRPFEGPGPVTLVAPNGQAASWLDNTTLVFSDGRRLMRVSMPSEPGRSPSPAIVHADALSLAARGATTTGRVLVRAASPAPTVTLEWYDELHATLAASQPMSPPLR